MLNSVSVNNTNTPASIYSSDCINWYFSNLSTAFYRTVSYGDEVFMAASYSSKVAKYSLDGVNWFDSITTITSGWNGSAFGNGKFVFVSALSSQTSNVIETPFDFNLVNKVLYTRNTETDGFQFSDSKYGSLLTVPNRPVNIRVGSY